MDKKKFEELKKSFNQMANHAAGRKVAGIREIVREVKPPVLVTKNDIIKLRRKLKVSQAAFALLLNISPKTVQAWELGTNKPNGSSLKLLAIARKDPEILYVS